MGLIRKFTLAGGVVLTLGSAGIYQLAKGEAPAAAQCLANVDRGQECSAESVRALEIGTFGLVMASTGFFAGTTLLSLGAFAGRRRKNSNSL